jgi:hydrogenase nickel incorporation protein HypA/HybF
MHEVSLCENIIGILERKAKEDGFSRVVRVQLKIGTLSGASRESLEFCFPLVAKGTIAESAKVECVETEGRGLKVGEVEVD